jgi:hypothetical protein
MNERIQQLAEQCYELDQSWTGVGHRIFNKEKFAQLIVQECIHVAYNKMAIQKLDGIRPSVVCDAIKEHFGVEQ